MTHGGKRPGAGAKPAVPGGRPHQIVVRLSDAEKALLDSLCERYEAAPSEVVRQLIKSSAALL